PMVQRLYPKANVRLTVSSPTRTLCDSDLGHERGFRRRWRGGHAVRRGRRWRQRNFQSVLRIVHENEGQGVPQLRREVIEIVFVSAWQNHCRDSSTLCAKNFLLDAANRQNLTA